jgi:hypothetical protein
VAKVEDDNFNFEEMNLPGEEPAQVELADEVSSVSAVESDDEAVVEQVEDAEEERKKDSDKLHFYLTCAGAAAIPLLLLVLASAQVIFPATAIYLVCLGLIPFGLWMGRETNTVFTIFLGFVLAAVFTGVYCLWIELGRHNFDINAREVKQRVGMTLPVEHGNWPAPVERDLA